MVECQSLKATARVPRWRRPLSAEDRTLLWRFRFALVSDKRALTKFLQASGREREFVFSSGFT